MQKIKEMRKSIQNIKECLSTLNGKITVLSEYISEQKMVEIEEINAMMSELMKLSQTQQECYNNYMEMFPNEKCSNFLSEIELKVNEIEEKVIENKRKEEAMYIIVKFESIRSDIDSCQKCLDEYAEQLRNIDAIQMSFEEYRNAVAQYEDFYQIVKSESLYDKISYSTKNSIFASNYELMLHLIRNEIYVCDKEQNKFTQVEAEKTNDALLEIKTKTNETNDEIKNDNIDYNEKNCKEQPEFTDEQKEIINEFVNVGVLVGARCDYGEVKIINNDTTGCAVDTKTFKRDMEKLKEGNGFLLFAFNKFVFISDRLLQVGHKYDRKEIDFSLAIDHLLRSGYIMKRTIGDYLPIYDITLKTCESLKVPQNKSWFDRFKTSRPKFPSNILERKPEAVKDFAANDILTELCYVFWDEICFSEKIEAMTTIDEYFYVGKHNIGGVTVFSSATFLADENSVVEYVDIANEYINKIENNIPVAIIMSDSIEECQKIIAYWKKHSYKFEYTSFYCYAIKDKTLWNFEKNIVIEPSKIIECILAFKEKKDEIMVSNESVDNVVDEGKDVVELTEDSIVSENNIVTDKIDVDAEKVVIKEATSVEAEATFFDKSNDITTDRNNISMSKKRMISSISVSEVLDNVYSMIIVDKAYCASAYLNALSADNRYAYLRNVLAFAMNAPDKKGHYISNVVTSVFDDTEYDFGQFIDYLKVCAGLRALFYNVSKQDFGYRQMYDVMYYLDIVQNDSPISTLMYKLKEFKDKYNIGIDAVADYRRKESLESSKRICDYSAEAQNMYKQHVNSPIKERCALPRYIAMKKLMFRKDKELAECLKIVAGNTPDEIDYAYVSDFIYKNFIEEGMDIKSGNIRRHSIGEFVDSFWEEAGKSQRDKQKSSKLVSELRHNICGIIKKIVVVICDWYYFSNSISSNRHAGNYDKDKNIMLTSVISAINSCDEQLNVISNSCQKAGIKCIKATLEEFRSRLDGSYVENENKYYYVDFLMYGDVILDDDFIPDCTGYNIDIPGFMPFERIVRHSNRDNRDFSERIAEIFNESEIAKEEALVDDYGSAELIKQYFYANNREWDDARYDIEANASDAFKAFNTAYEYAIGTFELHQSYGMINADLKEKILKLTKHQFDKAEANKNYGYFKRVLNAVIKNIMVEAKIRETTLNENLNNVIEEYSHNEDAMQLIEEAKEMMKKQNYTVAEDIIHRIQSNDFSYRESIMFDDEDNLNELLIEYDAIYRIVDEPRINLVMAINKNTKGPRKDTKRGAILIDNFPQSNITSIEKIKKFIMYLGFNVDTIKKDESRSSKNSYNSYNVELKKNTNGKKENFTHPIAPFGSLALENGFRVVCLFGMFDTQRLIDKFKEIGVSKHTIVLLDYALKKQDRQELARKIKDEISDKIFIVIDRVVAYYLADHYAENKINRMLMKVTMPYSSYQPYSIDAARAIPVEMFMGRKKQLGDIESPTGSNIIYGGRQLGKSALLRMAKADIDKNENGDRAVYVEIKDCNYTVAARKISETLVDEGILDEGCECDNWSDLSRQIKKRLTSEEKIKIPYLLLLIDEADTFIESCKEIDYAPLDNLEDIQSVGVGRFKFVVAGLRNLVRFEREKATSNNSVLAHLSHKTIMPFDISEAQELLEKPLYYLGFRFPKDKSMFVPLILANTNYFPGLIHFYCAKLIESLKKNYAGYNQVDTPPYEVNETHIKKVLADPEFNQQIKEKFEITLKLDNDNYYHIIAVIIAYCSYSENKGDGYTVEDVYNIAQDYCISKIQKLEIIQLTALMDELCELNILSKSVAGEYMFARYNFLQLLGTSEEIENMILNYSEE